MDTSESQPPSVEPNLTFSVAETLIPEPAHWSDRARRWLTIALVIGSLALLIGVLLFFGPATFQSIEDVLKMYLGLVLMPIGAGLIFLAARTLKAAPDQLYQLPLSGTPRQLFIAVWIVGLIASLVLRIRTLGDFRPISLVSLALASALVLSGGLWAYRWFANKLQNEWPTGRLESPPAVLLRWPRSWPIGWAAISGILGAILAGGLEVLFLWLAAMLFRSALADALQSVSVADDLTELLRQPIILIGALVGVAIIAPMIEEACKAIGLRLMRGAIQRPIDGLMMGMAIGISFGMVESGLYLSALGTVNWLVGGWLRLSTLILHGIATSIVGVAYARSLRSGRRRDLLAGYGRAVLLHGTWNAVAIGISFGFSLSACLGIACVIVLLLLIGVVIPRTVLAGVQTVIQEGYGQANESLPPEWSPADYGLGWRLMGSRPIFTPPMRTVTAPEAVAPQTPIGGEYVQRVEDDLKTM